MAGRAVEGGLWPAFRSAWAFAFSHVPGASLPASHAWEATVMGRYSEPHRAYHGMGHVEDCMTQLNGLVAPPPAPLLPPHHLRPLCIALLFHDVVYDPKSKTNEEDSAGMAVEACRDVFDGGGVDYPTALGCADAPHLHRRIVDLIMLTKHGRDASVSDDPAAPYLLDIDLSILGRSSDAFDAYDQAIRAEYAWVPEEAYRTGRMAVLRAFLDRPRLYITPPFHAAFETAARANLTAAVVRLEGAGATGTAT